jgi:hypothetical protein
LFVEVVRFDLLLVRYVFHSDALDFGDSADFGEKLQIKFLVGAWLNLTQICWLNTRDDAVCTRG